MATLADKINKNKSILKRGQGLFETTQETLMSRIRDRGVAPGAASSPMGAAGIGAQPDSAKMAGSAAQMQRAIKESVSPEEARKPREDRSILREEEQAAKEKADKLSNLELLGERIGGIVNQAVDNAKVTNVFRVDVQEDVVKSTYPNFTDEQRKKFEQKLAEIVYDNEGNPQITDDIVEELNSLLPEGAEPLTAEDVKPFITSGQLQFNKKKAKDTYPDITDEQITALERIAANVDFENEVIDKDDLNEASAILGIGKENREEIIAKIKELITPVATTVIDNITSTLGPAVLVSDFTEEDWNAFGLSGAKELYSLLGLDAASPEVQAMTIGDLQEKIDTLMQADYDRVEELVRVANDPFYPDNIRKAAQAELRDLSSVGVIATESDFAKLNEAVQSADEIEIAGKTYTTEELLSDEQLTVIIATYLEDPESDYSKDLASSNGFPALVEFIEDNKAALEDALKYLDEDIKKKIEVAKQNDAANVYSSKEGPDIDMTDLNKDILGDEFEDGVFVSSAIETGVFTVGEGEDAITYHYQDNIRNENSKFNAAEKRVYIDALVNAEKAGYDELKNYLATTSSEDIQTAARGFNISITDFINRKFKQAKTASILNLEPEGYDAQKAVEEIFGGVAKLNKLIKSAKEAAIFVTGEYGEGENGGLSKDALELKNNLMFNDDGTLNYAATIEKLKVLNSGRDVISENGLDAVMNDTNITSKKYEALWKLTRDGKLTYEEAITVLNAGDDNIIEKMAALYEEKSLTQKDGTSIEYPTIVETWAANKINEVFASTELSGEFKKLFNIEKFEFSSDTPGVYDLDSVMNQYTFLIDNLKIKDYNKEFTDDGIVLSGLNATAQARVDAAKETYRKVILSLNQLRIGKPKVVQQKIDAMISKYKNAENKANNIQKPAYVPRVLTEEEQNSLTPGDIVNIKTVGD